MDKTAWAYNTVLSLGLPHLDQDLVFCLPGLIYSQIIFFEIGLVEITLFPHLDYAAAGSKKVQRRTQMGGGGGGKG